MAGDSVQQIKERLSIIDVVSQYVELHKAGKSFKGKSPFTNEKTPSFFVSPERGMYYCFSTSQGGDIFTFVEAMEGVDFKGALKILAEKAGVELVPEDPKKRSERDTGFHILEEATKFFASMLSDNEEAKAYLNDRGVTKETIEKWRIGYAPGPPHGGWREIRTHLSGMKYTDAQLLQTGLIKGGVEGKEPYDVFRDRIMFPLFDASGKVIAFSGRILSKDSEAPKYVNSPETDFFNKSEVLYGYDKAKQGIRHYDFSLIVEGQFDVVLCHQAGYTNTVAVSGTALTPHHVGLLQRLSNRVVLALDADRAGIAAVKRAADLMLARGIDVKVARIPEGSDPADIIKEDSKQFKEIIGHATHVIEFLLRILKEQSRDERTFKLSARDEVLPYILKMQNRIDAEHFEGVVAEALDTTKDAIRLELARLEEEERNKPQTLKDVPPTHIAEIVNSENIQSRKEGLIEYLTIATELIKKPYAEVLTKVLTDKLKFKPNDIIVGIPSERKSELLFTLEAQFSDMPERVLLETLNDKVHELHLLLLRSAIREQKERMYVLEREGDTKEHTAILEKTTTLQKELAEASVVKDIFTHNKNDEDAEASRVD